MRAGGVPSASQRPPPPASLSWVVGPRGEPLFVLSKISDAMRTTLTIWACVMVALTGLAAERNIANRRSISVSGTAVSHTQPDVIVWTLEISDSDKDMLAAKRSNDQRAKAILGLRKDLG